MTQIHLNLSKDNFLITDNLFFHILRKLVENKENSYIDEITYTSPIDDSMVCKLKCNGEELTITRFGENEIVIKIQGPIEHVKRFLKQMAIEASTLFTRELFINNVCQAEKQEIIQTQVYEGLKELYSDLFNKIEVQVD